MPKDPHSVERINKALIDIANGMSVSEAAEYCGCSVETMYFYMQKTKVVKKRPTMDSLTDADEERLGNWYVYCHYMGYFQKAVTNLQKEAIYLGRSYVSKRRFDQEWCKQFTLRIPYVQKSVSLYDNYSRICTIENKCLGALLIYCRNRSLSHCFEDPKHLYYLMQLDIVDPIKMMVAYSADGKTAPPLVINSNLSKTNEFEELDLPHNWIKYNWQEATKSKNPENPLTYYVEEVLKTHLILENVDKPILLFHKYAFMPISLAFYETCIQNKVYPVNGQMQRTAFKFHLSVQMETTFRVSSLENKQMSICVELIKEILEVKLTAERMAESFKEFGIYPLSVDKSVIDKLPRLQMRSIADSGSIAHKNAIEDIQPPEEELNTPTIEIEIMQTPVMEHTVGKTSHAIENNADKLLSPNSSSVAGQKRVLTEPTKVVTSKVMRMVIPPAKRKPPSSVVSGTTYEKVVITPNTSLYEVPIASNNDQAEAQNPLCGT